MRAAAAVAHQVLRSWRGSRSQAAYARRLGLKANAIASWEAGRRFPTISRALHAAEISGRDLAECFRAFEPSQLPAGYGSVELAAWLDRLRGAAALPELAARSGLSRHAVGRMLRGQTEPWLPDFLRLVEAITARVSDFVAALADIETVPALTEEYRLKQSARELAFAEPWSIAVLRVLETTTYCESSHRAGYVAEVLGIDLAIEERCIAQLEAARIIRWDDTRYVPERELTVNARATPQSVTDLKRHWAERSVALMGRETPPNRFSYNVFSCSAADFEKIREKHWQFYHDVRGIVAASSPAESVGLLTIHLVEWPPLQR